MMISNLRNNLKNYFDSVEFLRDSNNKSEDLLVYFTNNGKFKLVFSFSENLISSTVIRLKGVDDNSPSQFKLELSVIDGVKTVSFRTIVNSFLNGSIENTSNTFSISKENINSFKFLYIFNSLCSEEKVQDISQFIEKRFDEHEIDYNSHAKDYYFYIKDFDVDINADYLNDLKVSFQKEGIIFNKIDFILDSLNKKISLKIQNLSKYDYSDVESFVIDFKIYRVMLYPILKELENF